MISSKMSNKKTKTKTKSHPLFSYSQISHIGNILDFKGSQLGAFYPYVIVYCYLEFKLRYLKSLKLFSIRVKELFELIALRNKGDGCLLLLKAFS